MNHKKLVAIHQPNFFPWLGYFAKICRSDLFVYLDHVENNPRDPLWTKRVKVIVNKVEYWLTIPLSRPRSSAFLPINEMRISTGNFEKKHLRTIEQSYGKAPFFKEVFPLVEAFYAHPDQRVANRNIDFIENVRKKLHINTHTVRSSHYEWCSKSTDLLIEILRRFDGTAYLCGGGASAYQEDEKFESAGLGLIYQNFSHPNYQQFSTERFIPGLSIIDPLMNCGLEGTEKLLKGNL